METPGKGGRRHQYLTLPEEKEFLAPFFAQAESGEIATVAQIQHAYEAKVGHEVDESMVYRLLNSKSPGIVRSEAYRQQKSSVPIPLRNVKRAITWTAKTDRISKRFAVRSVVIRHTRIPTPRRISRLAWVTRNCVLARTDTRSKHCS